MCGDVSGVFVVATTLKWLFKRLFYGQMKDFEKGGSEERVVAVASFRDTSGVAIVPSICSR